MHYTTLVLAESRDRARRLLAKYNECDEDYYQFRAIGQLTAAEQWASESGKKLDDWLDEEGYVKRGKSFGYYDNPEGMYDWYDDENPDFVLGLYTIPGTVLDEESGCEPRCVIRRRHWGRMPYALVTPDGEIETPDTVGIKGFTSHWIKMLNKAQEEGYRAYFFNMHD